MLTISQYPISLYPSNNCRKPSFQAGVNNGALYEEMARLVNELEKNPKFATATKKTKRPLFQRILNVFKSLHSNDAEVNQSKRSYEINDVYLGHIFLTPKGYRQYSELLKKISSIKNKINHLKQEGTKHLNQANAYKPEPYLNFHMFDLDCYLLSTDSAEAYNHYKSKAERYFEKVTALEDRIREILSEWKKDRFKKNGELTFFDTIRNEGI